MSNQQNDEFFEHQMEMEKQIAVNKVWLESLLALATSVEKQLDLMPDEAFRILARSDIARLTGFAKSAETILNQKTL
jgi:hypothetical protein